MQAIGLCRSSYPGVGGFQVQHLTREGWTPCLYAPERMEERFRSFQTLTLPPLSAQTDGDFTFLIVIGDSLPPRYREHLHALVVEHAAGGDTGTSRNKRPLVQAANACC